MLSKCHELLTSKKLYKQWAILGAGCPAFLSGPLKDTLLIYVGLYFKI